MPRETSTGQVDGLQQCEEQLKRVKPLKQATHFIGSCIFEGLTVMGGGSVVADRLWEQYAAAQAASAEAGITNTTATETPQR